MGSVIGEITGGNSRAQKRALGAQQNATNAANQMQKEMFDQARKDQEPWRQAGANALGQIGSEMPELTRNFSQNDFQQDPGYQFRMAEGQKAIERGAAARGGLMGGRGLKDIARFGQDFASNEYSNAYNRFNNDRDQRFNKLSSLAGIGQSSASQIANQGMQAGQVMGGNLINMGNAQASAAMARNQQRSGAIDSAIQGGAQLFMMCDERLKTDIEPVSQEDLSELRDKVRAYKFKYKDQKHGAGEFVGVMAQELEQTRLGKDLVGYDTEGMRYINTQKLMSLLLATLTVGA